MTYTATEIFYIVDTIKLKINMQIESHIPISKNFALTA